MPDPTPDTILKDAEKTLTKLEKLCCQPERSPAMQAIADGLSATRFDFASFDGDVTAADSIVARLEETGSRIGKLQVGCCAPARMPLYAELLTSLTELQRAANAQVGRGH